MPTWWTIWTIYFEDGTQETLDRTPVRRMGRDEAVAIANAKGKPWRYLQQINLGYGPGAQLPSDVGGSRS